MLRIGLISDTHGLLRPQAKEFLRGCDHIVHGGDIGDQSILDVLSELAPITAVRGNNDKGAWAEALPESEFIQLGEIFLHVLHDLAQLDIEPSAAGVDVVISGHSHHPLVEHRGTTLFVNPGSAGPRRFRLPISIGELTVTGRSITSRLVTLDA